MVAVSGGCDSVALLLAMQRLAQESGESGNLVVAHVNHQTRPGSDQDEDFVRRLAEKLGLPFVVARANQAEVSGRAAPHGEQKTFSEETLRNLRYDWLVQLAGNQGARFLVTGHHRQDQVETVLFRLLRGTGIAGLAGIPRRRLINPSLTLVRPMLEIDRSELVAFLDHHQQAFCTDETNADQRYVRNWLRHTLVPTAKQRFPESESAISRLAQQAAETQSYLENVAGALLERCVVFESDGCRIELLPMKDQASVVVRTMLQLIWKRMGWSRQAMGHRWWCELADAMLAEDDTPVTLNLPDNISARRQSDSFLLKRLT